MLKPSPVEEDKMKTKHRDKKRLHAHSTSKHTNIISIEKSPQEDHLKRAGHTTKEHEQSSDNRHNVVDQESFFPAKSKETKD